MRCIAGFFFLAPVLAACSCADPRPACELFPSASAVFIGTVLEGNSDDSGSFMYIIRVDEALRGLAPDQKEVFIDPGSYTSCQTQYEIGGTFLFYAGGKGNLMATTVEWARERLKKVPPSWEVKRDLRVYGAAMCSGSKLLPHAADDLAWIRRAAAGEKANRVYGVAYQHYDRYWDKSANVPLAGAKVRLQGGGPSTETISGPDGEYSFEAVAPGKYHLWAERPPWEGSYRQPIELRAGGCVERALRLQSNGSIRGSVQKVDGKPAVDVRVELVRVLKDRTLAEDYSLRSDTNAQGQFHIREAPAGDFVVGVNLRSPMTADEPWPTTFFPGVPTQARARVLHLQPNQIVSDLHIKLPPPKPTRAVQVRVFWADGSPADGGARAYAEPLEKPQRFGSETSAKTGHIVELKLMQDYEYNVNASWYQLTRKKSLFVEGVAVQLPRGRDAAVVDIRLKTNRPADASSSPK